MSLPWLHLLAHQKSEQCEGCGHGHGKTRALLWTVPSPACHHTQELACAPFWLRFHTPCFPHAVTPLPSVPAGVQLRVHGHEAQSHPPFRKAKARCLRPNMATCMHSNKGKPSLVPDSHRVGVLATSALSTTSSTSAWNVESTRVLMQLGVCDRYKRNC